MSWMLLQGCTRPAPFPRPGISHCRHRQLVLSKSHLGEAVFPGVGGAFCCRELIPKAIARPRIVSAEQSASFPGGCWLRKRSQQPVARIAAPCAVDRSLVGAEPPTAAPPLQAPFRRSRGAFRFASNPSSSRGSRRRARAVMGSGGIFDLEKQFAQYGAYHSNKINILIHMIFVWPILFTAFTLLAYTQPLAPQTPFMAALPYHQYMLLNYSFVAAAVYALFYISLEQKSGSLAAFLVLVCWIGANAVAQHVPYSLGWKIVAVSQVVCWSFQFIGHGVFEGRAPALLDNLAQAFLMAPYFVLLEVLHSLLNYEPYAGFSKNVQNKVGVQIAEFRSRKAKGKRID